MDAKTMVYEASMEEEKLRKGPWHEEEDKLLVTYVTLLGDRKWDYIAKASGLKRSGKSCRLRWLNYLRPNIKHGYISTEEEQIIIQLHGQWERKFKLKNKRTFNSEETMPRKICFRILLMKNTSLRTKIFLELTATRLLFLDFQALHLQAHHTKPGYWIGWQEDSNTAVESCLCCWASISEATDTWDWSGSIWDMN
nr:MYB protein [Zanthoxylum bungeanum]